MTYPLIVTCGLFSSGSTWVYNAVAKFMLLTGSCNGAFASELEAGTVLPTPRDRPLVIKTHGWGRPSDFLQAYPGTQCIITIREPRDAVTSLMQRFGYDFPSAVDYVARSAEGIVAVKHAH